MEVIGYRAPSYSINATNLWALPAIAEAGYRYSSSIYPGKHDPLRHAGCAAIPQAAGQADFEIPITPGRDRRAPTVLWGGGSSACGLTGCSGRASGAMSGTGSPRSSTCIRGGRPRAASAMCPLRSRFRHYPESRACRCRAFVARWPTAGIEWTGSTACGPSMICQRAGMDHGAAAATTWTRCAPP